jgi:hypothetical protein
MCMIYGAEHFFTYAWYVFSSVLVCSGVFFLVNNCSFSFHLLVSLSQMIAYSSLDAESVNILRDYANEMLV